MEQEIWKPVVGYEGLYEVSNMGRVKRLKGWRCKEDRILKGYPQRLGHLEVSLSNNGIATFLYIHRLVLEAFVGPCPEGMEACHNNGNPADNRLSNLRWDTRSSNAADRILHGTSPRGSKNVKAKLTEHNVREIRQMIDSGMNKTQIAAAFGVSKYSINHIASGRAWGWLE